MMKAIYKLGDLSLNSVDGFPFSLKEGITASCLVLANDIDGHEYYLMADPAGEASTLHSLGKNTYVEVRSPSTFRHPQRASVMIPPGKYRLIRESQYIHTEHGRQVASLAVPMAEALRFDEQHLKELEFASIIHDIGFAEREDVLWKTQWFGDEEWQNVKQHPVVAARLVERLIGRHPCATERVRDYVLYHHEHLDGSGYLGLKGNEIPMGARIIFIADAYHAMISWRPFREPLPEHVALDRLWDDAEYRYDPDLLQVFTNVLEEASIAELANWG